MCIFKKKKEQIPQMLIETNKELNNKKSYFSNGDYYSNEEEFIKNFVKIIMVSDEYKVEETTEFGNAIEYLIKNNYLVSCNNNDSLIDALNNNFKENINKELITKKLEQYNINNDKYTEAIKKNIIELAICEQLEKQNKGLIYIYSAGDYYCYGIEPLEKINEIKNMFK